jgi:hypothetical protein
VAGFCCHRLNLWIWFYLTVSDCTLYLWTHFPFASSFSEFLITLWMDFWFVVSWGWQNFPAPRSQHSVCLPAHCPPHTGIYITPNQLLIMKLPKHRATLPLSLLAAHKLQTEDDCLLGCYAMQSGRSLLTFQRCLLISTHHPNDGGSKHLWNVSKLLPYYKAQHPRRLSSSYLPPWEPEISSTFRQCLLWPDTSN